MEKKEQARAQLYLARKMAHIIMDLAEMQLCRIDKADDGIVEIMGGTSHAWLEKLGDCINAVDAATPEDEAEATPVFEGARLMFPLGR